MKKFVIIILIAALAICGVYFGIKQNKSNSNTITEIENVEENKLNEGQIAEKEDDLSSKINIFNGTDRPIAFMIDNNVNAQPQSSINSAYIVYEIIVEGGETRLMAIFKGVDCDQVGPIRSARHYFLDYAMENDAIYAHLGMSPQADAQMLEFNIDHINGQIYDTGKERTETSLYWRASHRKAPHNAYTNIESILKIAKDKGFKTVSNTKSVLNYVPNEVMLDGENSFDALDIIIPYTTSHKVEYKYDENSKRYIRYSKNRKMTDEITKEDVTTKNIIITFAKNYTLDDGENKGRQDVVTTGVLDGYYITNGKAIEIKCKKENRNSQTEYLDLDGNKIEVNDGNTWVNIVPIDSFVTIK